MTKHNGSGVWKWVAGLIAAALIGGTGHMLGSIAKAQSDHGVSLGHPVLVERVETLVRAIDKYLAAQRAYDTRLTGMGTDVADIKGDVKVLLDRSEGDRP